LECQVQLVFMSVGGTAIFRASIGEHSAERNLVLVEERHHSIVEQVRCGKWGSPVVHLGETNLAIGIDERLLINAPHALHRSDIESVLCSAVAGALALEFSMGFLVGLGLLHCYELRLRQD